MTAVNLPPSLRRSTVVRELSIETWAAILKCVGSHDSICSELTHDAISDFLTSSDTVHEVLFDALQKINSLGCSYGRNLIEQAADGVGVDLGISDDESDRELAARLWILSREKKELLQVLARAYAASEFCKSPRDYKEFAGETGIKITCFDKDKFKRIVSDWCLKNKKSGVVDIFAYAFDDVWCCDIIRGDPIKKVSVIRDSHQDVLSYRPAKLDHITIEPASGRIRILSNSPKLTTIYKETMGEVLTNSTTFFSTEKICSLDPLQKVGAGIFDDVRFHQIQRVTVTELTWRRGDRDTLIVKGIDCLKLLNELSARLETGKLVEAKLRFAIAGNSRPVFAVLKVPIKISVSNEEYEPLIYRFLDCVGLRGRFESEELKSFWELEPWHYSEADWRKFISSSFDQLKLDGCLRYEPMNYVRHPEVDNDSGVMEVESDGFDNAIAVSKDLGLRSLTNTDIEGYRLEISILVSKVTHSLGITLPAQEISNGLWHLGEIQLSETECIQVFFAAAVQNTDIGSLIDRKSSGCKPVLILPNGCSYSTHINTVQVNVLELYFDDLLARIVRVLDLTRLVDPSKWCRADLVFDRERGQIWYKQMILSSLSSNTHAYKFAVMVAESNGSVMADDAIASRLTVSQERNVVRKAKSDFIAKVKQAFEDSGQVVPDQLSKKLFKRQGRGEATNCSIAFIT